MAHIEERVLQSYLDNEVGARAEVESHLAQCALCAAELDRLRAAAQLFASAMRAEDVTAPVLAAQVAFRRAQGGVIVPRRSLPRVPLARAAMLLIGLAAVASATIPGSPVRAWFADVLRSGDDRAEQRETTVQPPAPEPAAPARPASAGAAGVSVEPVDGRIWVYLSEAAPDAEVQVRREDTDRASVQLSGAASPRFRTGAGRIEVVGVGKTKVTVLIPRTARDVRVEVDGRLIYQTGQ